jgi:Patatin-like phospholipase
MASILDDQTQDAFNRVEEASLKLLDLDRRPVPRDQHPKHHGCVRAVFVIEKGLANTYRIGLFEHEEVYDAWLRFSNGAQRDDRKPDVHGLAIKLMEVPGTKALDDEPDGTTHDFVMVDHPIFFLRDAKEYAAFTDALLKARGKVDSSLRNILSYLLPGRACELLTLILLFFFPWRLRTFSRLIRFASSIIKDPLSTRYWSTTPYKFGETHMKFRVVPAKLADELESQGPSGESYAELSDFLAQAQPLPVETGSKAGSSPDYLQMALSDRLKDKGAVFLFEVQLYKDASKTPIDDPTVKWLENDSPFVTLARIWIPKDEEHLFCSETRQAFGENLSFTPWHALAANKPEGEINNVRLHVYKALSIARHKANGVIRREPRAVDDPSQVPEYGNDPSAFPTVLSEELKLIRERREKVENRFVVAQPHTEQPGVSVRPGDEDARTKEFRLKALGEHVSGLAFSGGGIRSGTFAVGFLQGLASSGLIRRFDYLSTVSGGGYAGAWLAAWLRREGGDPENVQRMLSPNRVVQSKATRQLLERGVVVDEEPEPLRHLRSYSSYLFPHPGILSSDTWTVILIWLRNVTINLMMLLPASVLVVVLARFIVYMYHLFNPLTVETPAIYLITCGLVFAIGLLCAWVAHKNNSRALRAIRDQTHPDPGLRTIGTPNELQALVVKGILNPVTVAALFLTLSIRGLLWSGGDVVTNFKLESAPTNAISLSSILLDSIQSHSGLLEWPCILFVALIVGGLMAWGGRSNALNVAPESSKKFIFASFIAGLNGGVLFVLVAALIRWFARLERPDLMATFAAPLAVLVVVVSLIVLVALLGRTIGETEREWWARLSGLVTLRALAWIGLMATILYVPGLFLASGPLVQAAVASGWLGTAALGVLTGRYVLPRVGGLTAGRLTVVASVASQLFLVGLMGMVALVVSLLSNIPSLTSASADDIGPFAFYILGVIGASPFVLIFIAIIAGVLYYLARDLIDVNLFSLNAMYANRLTRCYIGASRAMSTWVDRWRLPRDLRTDAGAPALADRSAPVREPNPVTGFDAGDDIDLGDLKIGKKDSANREYLGPHLLINTTLNLVGDKSLLRRDRKGESFILSPLYCGSKSIGYARIDNTQQPGNVEPNLTLGRAISISGAAVDPNMSFYQSGPLTALLTIFNARLGYWIEKPKPMGWTAASPKFGNLILSELFGRTDEHGEFVHISDGGHFENLGVYELIRRRCRYIVALDAGEDGDASDENLANLIRLCRIDFGVRLKINTEPLEMAGPDRLRRAHVAIGEIHYEDVDQGEIPGVFVFVKISLTGDEPPDLQKYAREEPLFPYQPTDLRQSFDEKQFECYRCLGDHIAREVFGDPVDQVRDDYRRLDLVADKQPHDEYVARLFTAVQERWSEAPAVLSELYLETNRNWSEIQRDLSKNPELKQLSQDLYPELQAIGTKAHASQSAELHTIGRMLAIMENAWIALSLKRYSSLPINRGWMNSFRRWAATEAFRRTWPVLRSEFSSEFVRFCEEQLHLNAAEPSVLSLPSLDDFLKLPADDSLKVAIDLLDNEFQREWPDEHRQGRGPKALVAASSKLKNPPLAWLIVQAQSGQSQKADQSPNKFVCGVILATRSDQIPQTVLPDGTKQDSVEFFVWIRRAYRAAGLGSQCVQEVLPKVRESLRDKNGHTPSLWSRYPKQEASDDDLEFANLVRFLARFDFRVIEPTTGSLRASSLLQLP